MPEPEIVKNSAIKKDGFSFSFNQAACGSCGARCCRGNSGNIWVTSNDINNICKLLGVNQIDGLRLFFQKRENQYTIREQLNDHNDYRCIFLNNLNLCSIYDARPAQCRTYPFWEHFKIDIDGLVKECKGVQKL